MTEPQLHLASGSPRRREILDSLGLRYAWAAVDIDETAARNEAPGELALRLAAAKARAYAGRQDDAKIVLGADTVVTLDGRLFGKPGSAGEAVDMLRELSGRTHTVMTAVAVLAHGHEHTAVAATEVTFRPIDRAEAEAYCDSREPEGKAGGYAIQGRGGVFVASLSGSYSGVVGLPVFETAALLRTAGLDVLTGRPVAPGD